jgi:APA family basic amino acid/polyamine antiporter
VHAEFASTVPVRGSAYTFSYATLGELIAWIIGWDLLLELMLGASVVAQGWSTYSTTLLGNLGFTWPEVVGPGSHFDLPAFVLVAVLTGEKFEEGEVPFEGGRVV